MTETYGNLILGPMISYQSKKADMILEIFAFNLSSIKQIQEEGGRGWWLDSITNLMNMNLSKPGDSGGCGGLVCCRTWVHQESDLDLPTGTTTTNYKSIHG